MSRPDCPLFGTRLFGDNVSVTKTQERSRYLAEIRAIQSRIRMAREATNYSQSMMAKALGIKTDMYKKYENREGSSMPLVIFAQFCEITGQEPFGLLTGKRLSAHARKAG